MNNDEKPVPEVRRDNFYEKLSLEEKRKYYLCKERYITLGTIETWAETKKNKGKAFSNQTFIQSNVARAFIVAKPSPYSSSPAMDQKISLWLGDITQLEIDAVVNATDPFYSGRGGVDAAVHLAAGSELNEKCETLKNCPVGHTKLTPGYCLPAKYILHTVGPRGADILKLTACYKSCFNLVLKHNIKSVAFCNIATGEFGFPESEAADIALSVTREWMETNADKINRIIFCIFSLSNFEIYIQKMIRYFPPQKSQEEHYNFPEVTGAGEQPEMGDFVKIVEEAAADNKEIERKIAHSTFVGPPGSGKTSFMDRLLGRPRKEFSPSTGVCGSVIVVDIDITKPCTLQAANILESDDWEEVECNESFVGQMQQETHSGQMCQETHSEQMRQETHSERTKITNSQLIESDLNGEFIVLSMPASSKAKRNSDFKGALTIPLTNPQTKLQEPKVHIFKFNDSTCSIIKKYGFKKFKKYLKKTFSLYLRDTGGQVEFQEILGLLIFGPSIFFFLFNIALNFQEKFSIEYRISASESTNQYTSSITTEEALLQCLSTVYAMDTSSESRVKTHKPLVFIIGTHIDELQARIKDNDLDTKIAELNKHLDSLLINNGFRDLVQYFDMEKGKVMFTVNNKSDSDEDFRMIRSRVNNLIKGRDEFTIRYPLKYLLFCLDLQNVKECILTLDECKAMAAAYGITGEQVIHLLHFIHSRIGIIRYFDVEGLRHIIVKEPQVLFKKVTDLIIKTFSSASLRDTERNDFKKKGIFSASSFKSIVDTDDKISSNEFLKLLVHLRIIAPFPGAPGELEEKFFMPCVLNHVPESNLTLYTDILPLAITFECRRCPKDVSDVKRQCCPKGVFGVLATHIMTPESDLKAEYHTRFELMEDKIFRDEVSFNVISREIQKDQMSISVNSLHLEIKFFPYSGYRKVPIQEICNAIREILEKLIVKSLRDLHYNEERIKPIMCLRCENCDELHQVERAEKCTITCEKTHTIYPIPSQGRCWYNEACHDGSSAPLKPHESSTTSASQPPSQGGDATDHASISPVMESVPSRQKSESDVSIPSRREVKLALKGITKEWDDLAEALGLPDSEIDAIKADNPHDVKQCLKEVVDGWFKLKGSRPPSWIDLCTALRDDLVNRKDIALNIEKSYLQ